MGIGFGSTASSHARITHKETYFRAEYVPTGCTYGTVRADTHGSYATPAQGRITHKYVIQDYVPARFKGGLRSKPPSHTRKRDTNQHTEQIGLKHEQKREPRPSLLGQVTVTRSICFSLLLSFAACFILDQFSLFRLKRPGPRPSGRLLSPAQPTAGLGLYQDRYTLCHVSHRISCGLCTHGPFHWFN